MKLAKPLADILEDELRLQIIGTKNAPGVARLMNWRCYHTLRSKGSEAGYPDWSLFRERHLYIELKREKGVLSAHQAVWLSAIMAAGVEAYVVRPRHFDHIAHVLRARGPIAGWTVDQREARGHLLLDLQADLDKHLAKEAA